MVTFKSTKALINCYYNIPLLNIPNQITTITHTEQRIDETLKFQHQYPISSDFQI